MSRLQYSTEIRLIRVMCTGRLDPAFVLRAFSKGADGILIGGCRFNECNYTTHGNLYALSMVSLLKRWMEHMALHPDRLRMELLSSAEGNRFAETVNDFVGKIKELGPIGESGGIGGSELTSRLKVAMSLVPYVKLVTREKLEMRLHSEEEYVDLFTKEELGHLLQDVTSFYIDPQKCQACMTCAKRCPVEAIAGGKNRIHVIDQETCIKCGTCFEVCPPRFGAVVKISGEPVPPPIPEDKRTIDRKQERDRSVN